jgi:Dolichyl-phosphate-mannose-protein mannosyltransferase
LVSFSYLNQSSNWKNLSLLFLIAFLVRGSTFLFFVQDQERYRQPDSHDYHISAIGLAIGRGMYHIQTNKPIFWRTPGYPAYLSLFYRLYGITNPQFGANAPAQKASIWFQILLCSFIPILTFFLAFHLTKSLTIAWITGLIFTFHIGFILSSCYLLTDALASVLFTLFLLAFYYAFSFIGETQQKKQNQLLFIFLAAILLALYTWMRPHGEFIALLVLFILALCHCTWQQKLLKIIIFGLTFFMCIFPWYVRNHDLTGHWFFCPMSGPYLMTFSAPKIIRHISEQPLDKCIKFLFMRMKTELNKEEKLTKIIALNKVIAQELICGKVAWPWIKEYPHYFLLEWCKEVFKTTFDLYGSQLVAFANNSFKYDPLEEFLGEKLKLCIQCLYQ